MLPLPRQNFLTMRVISFQLKDEDCQENLLAKLKEEADMAK